MSQTIKETYTARRLCLGADRDAFRHWRNQEPGVIRVIGAPVAKMQAC